MKRLIAIMAALLTSGAFVSLGAFPASAAMQRGSQSEARTLVGHVLNDRSEPVQKAIVYAKNTKTLAIKTYITEADGSYRFPGLAPNVDYEVYAEHEGLHTDTKTLSGFDNRKEANITLKLHSK
jgi:hypothetical protein